MTWFTWLLMSGDSAGLVIQFLLGKVAYSTSNGAALYLLAYALAVLWVSRRSDAFGKIAWPVFLVCLVLGHSVNLWLTIGYLDEMKIPWHSHVYHWDATGYSFTGLFHSHLGKTAFAVFAEQIGWQPAGYDSGSVFLHWVPQVAAWVVALSFFGALIAGLACAPRFFGGRRGASAWLWLLASAIATRGMIDGGALAPGVFPAFLVVLGILFGSMRWSDLKSALVLVALLIFYLVFWLGGIKPGEWPALGSLIFPLLLFVWLYLAGLERSLLLPRILLVGMMAFVVALDASSNLLPLLVKQDASCYRHLIGESSHLTSATCSGENPFAIYQKAGEDPRKPRHVLLATGDDSGTRRITVRVLILEAKDGKLQIKGDPIWQDLKVMPISLPNAWLALQVESAANLPPVLFSGDPSVISRNNFAVYLWALADNLQRAGLSEFVLLPETRFNAVLGDS